MRLAVIKSRLALVDERGAIDVAAVSAGKFSPDPQSLSAVLPLLPGDPIFTGTAAGIGWARGWCSARATALSPTPRSSER